MTTRAEEIAGEWYPDTTGPDGEIIYMEGQRQVFVNGYKQGQQDRWISVKDRMPEPNIEVLVAFADDTVAGTSQWCRVKSPDIMGWLGPAENKGKTITHWTPLPLTP